MMLGEVKSERVYPNNEGKADENSRNKEGITNCGETSDHCGSGMVIGNDGISKRFARKKGSLDAKERITWIVATIGKGTDDVEMKR